MKITKAKFWRESNPLTRPYKIAYRVIDSVEIIFVRLETANGMSGFGAASPAEFVTGESYDNCELALENHLSELVTGTDVECVLGTCARVQAKLYDTPAASAAVDMALLDLFGKWLDRPIVSILGRQHKSFLTSITIGIKSIEESIAEAKEYHSRGFKIIKLKVGKDVDKDIELIHKVHEAIGNQMRIRVDANQGYLIRQYKSFLEKTKALRLEFVEQPLPVDQVHRMLELDPREIDFTAGDENIQKPIDALNHAGDPKTFGIYNIKLMKCGGITSALQIARIADLAGIDLMWGCMDESRVSIAAGLHAALSCSQTRYIDLDGSFDLKQHLFKGGFVLKDGKMSVNNKPGLGVEFM